MQHVVVITGATRGLGRGIAKAFLRNGWRAALLARGEEKLQSLKEELGAHDESALFLSVDVSQSDQVEKAISLVSEKFGGIDVLINNAALDHPGSIEDLTVEQWNEVIGVNLSGAFYLSKAVFPIMKKQKNGFIVNISSVAGKRGWPNATAYCASKFALTGFTQALGSEGRQHNIRCCVCYPGGIDTNWHAERDASFMQPDELGSFIYQLVSLPANLVPNEVVVTPLSEKGYP
jgi:NAD(P)-dependent dehydrogenase (short-subunit alcohol dehydrogenase family)